MILGRNNNDIYAVLNDKHWDVKPLLQLSSLITNGNTPAGGSENYVSNPVAVPVVGNMETL